LPNLPRRIRFLLTAALPVVAFLAACGSEAEVADPTEATPEESTATTLVRPSRPVNQPGASSESGTVIAISPDLSLDVCDLVPVGEAQRITGREMSAPRAVYLGEPLGQKVCTFAAADRTFATVLQVSVVDESVFSGSLAEGGYTIEQLFAETKALYPAAIAVTGIGDDAFRHGDTLEVLFNGYTIGVSLSLGSNYTNEAASLDTLAAIAAIALQSLSQS
jgi:hypothetical protein